MTVTWVIELEGAAPERARADLLVAPLFEGERPLRGAAARLDWRLCGHLSAMVARDAFSGAEGEVVLVPLGTRARAPRALLVGLGPRKGFGPRGLRQAVRQAVGCAAALGTGVVAVALPDHAASGVPIERAAAAAVVGAGEALEETPMTLRLRLVSSAGLSRARPVLTELVERISLPGMIVRLSAADLPPQLEAPGGDEASTRSGPLAGAPIASAASQAKFPSSP